ncbi:MAG: helix-turn-helix transcriptional regulator [Pseudomonadota bacterium]|nr:helix-turn-helix transcriptional regulator [Pseudomonadota bacterium]
MEQAVRRRGGRPKSDGPSPVDKIIGSRLRLRRIIMGYSQDKLGRMIGLTFQQIQKYERGANRISASRLHRLAGVLNVPVSYFYEDNPANSAVPGFVEGDQVPYEPDPVPNRETLEMARAWQKIRDPRVRRRIFELAKAVASLDNPDQIPDSLP